MPPSSGSRSIWTLGAMSSLQFDGRLSSPRGNLCWALITTASARLTTYKPFKGIPIIVMAGPRALGVVLPSVQSVQS